MESLPKQYLESSHITADVKAFGNEYPTVSDATPNKPLDLVCGPDDPPTPGSAVIMPSYDQDHPPLTSTDTQEDSASATCSSAAPHNQVFMEHSVSDTLSLTARVQTALFLSKLTVLVWYTRAFSGVINLSDYP